MPRKSTSARQIEVLRVNGATARLQPPERLSNAAAKVFREIVASVDSSHFVASDMPLLEMYVNAVALGDEANTKLNKLGAVIAGKASPWLVVAEKCQRAAVALSLRLRLSPQSRFDRLRAGTSTRGGGTSRGVEALVNAGLAGSKRQ